MIERLSLSKGVAALSTDGLPSPHELESHYGDLASNDTAALADASSRMKLARFSASSRIAYEALIKLQAEVVPNYPYDTYQPESEVTKDVLDDIKSCVADIDSKFTLSISSMFDVSEHPEMAHIIHPHVWMADFEHIRQGNQNAEPSSLIEGAVNDPFEFTVRELLVEIIPKKWEEWQGQFPEKTPLTIGKLFEIAFARSTGHVLSKLASYSFKEFVPLTFGMRQNDENDVEHYDTRDFTFDGKGISLQEDLLSDAIDLGLQQLEERGFTNDFNEFVPEKPKLGCIMNASQRGFDKDAPAQTLMMAYYHLLLSVVQKSMYHEGQLKEE